MMNPWLKRTAISLCLVTALAAPALAAETAPVTGVHLISAPVAVIQSSQVPSAVTVNGKTLSFDQGPAVVDGVLMVPLRAIAEAAGGMVTWAGEIHMVHVQMPDRTIMIRMSQSEAEMHQNGVTYPDRNRVAMAKAPVILGDRTMVSADALTSVFGFRVQSGADGTLALTAPGFPQQPKVTVPVDPEVARNNQLQVDGGHSPYLLSPAMVAMSYLGSQGISGDVDTFTLSFSTSTHAVVNIPSGPISRVYVQKLGRQDETGIWSVVGYDF